jgi:hypothetical protein
LNFRLFNNHKSGQDNMKIKKTLDILNFIEYIPS